MADLDSLGDPAVCCLLLIEANTRSKLLVGSTSVARFFGASRAFKLPSDLLVDAVLLPAPADTAGCFLTDGGRPRVPGFFIIAEDFCLRATEAVAATEGLGGGGGGGSFTVACNDLVRPLSPNRRATTSSSDCSSSLLSFT